MNELEMKRVILGQLLDLMKYANEEHGNYVGVGIHVEGFGFLDEKIWIIAKTVAGIPEGVFQKDMWYEAGSQYKHGEMEREEAINQILSWKSVIRDL